MIVEQIKALCKQHGISVRRLEMATGLSSGSISKWTKSSPSLDACQKIAEYFGVSLDYLTGNLSYRKGDTQDIADHKLDFYHDQLGVIENSRYHGSDVKRRLESILREMEQMDSDILFNGERMDDQTRTLFLIGLENLLENTKNKFVINRRS